MFNLINTSLRASVCLFAFFFFSSSFIKAQSVSIQSYDAKTSASGATSHSLTAVPAGALLVVSTTGDVSGNGPANCTVSGGSLTWTKRADANLSQSGNAEIHTVVFTNGGSITITSDWGSVPQSSVCYVMINQEPTLGGAVSIENNQAAPSVSITTTRANSILIVATSDWNAIEGNPRWYRSSLTERNYHYVANNYTGYNYYRTAPSVTSYTVGLTSPSTMKAGTAVLEIRSPAPDTQPPSAITDLISTGQTSNTISLSWTAATDNVGIAGYDVYLEGILVGGTTNTTTYTITDLPPNSEWSIYVKARDVAGNTRISNTITEIASADHASIQSYNAQTSAGEATTHSLTSVPAGALLVVSTTGSVVGDGPSDCSVSGGSLDWTKRVDANAAQSGNAEIWTAVSTAGGAITVTSDWGNVPQSSGCYVISNHESILNGVWGVAVSQDAPSVSITTTRSNSILFVATADWNAIDGSSKAYRNSPIERNYHHMANEYTGYNYYYLAANTGSYTIGLSSPSTMKAGTAVLEIRSPGPADIQAPSVITDLSSPAQTSSTISLSWTAATDNIGVAAYDIYKNGAYHSTTTNTTATVNGLTPSTAYNISVRAKDVAGNSTNSNTLTESTEAFAGVDYLGLPLYTGTGQIPGNPGIAYINGSTSTITISNVKFKNTLSGTNNGNGLWLDDCSNVIIENCWFDGMYERALFLYNCTNITVRNCLFTNSSRGLVAEQCDGNIKVLNNEFINMTGEHDPTECCKGQAVYYSNSNGAGNQVSWNRVLNFLGESFNQDLIGLFQSGGTSGSHFRVSGNVTWGGGPGRNGCSIIVGDGVSSDIYVDIDSNRVLQFAATGIAVAGGNHISATNNMVWGEENDWSGGGYYALGYSTTCNDINMSATNKTWSINRSGIKDDATFPEPPPIENGCTNCTCGVDDLGTSLSNAYGLITSGIADPKTSLFLSEDDLCRVRADKTWTTDIVVHGNHTGSGSDPHNIVDLTRPIADADDDETISTNTYSLDGTGSSAVQPPSPMTGTNTITYKWVQVSGPNNAIMSAQTSATNNLSGLINGTYEFRLEATQTQAYNNANLSDDYNYQTWHADWIEVTVNSQLPATLNGSVTLQGRPTPPHSRWQIPLQVDFYANGNITIPVYTYTVTTDASGNFTITDIPPGTYTIGLKNTHTLRRVKEDEELVSGNNSINFGTLVEGDVNNDNNVNIKDLATLLAHYNQCTGYSNFLLNADLNSDGCTTGMDLGIILANNGTIGETLDPDPPGRFFNPSVTGAESIKSIPENSKGKVPGKLAGEKIYSLGQNYPNPFNKETIIQFTIPKPEKVNLSLFDVSGRIVKVLVNGSKDAGTHTINFNVGSLANGVYYYRMQAGDFTDVKKLTIQ